MTVLVHTHNSLGVPAAEVGGWIYTHTGRKFWPLRPSSTHVDIRDIAHALALKCRYGGHCREFYSVAQHSVLVSQVVEGRLKETKEMFGDVISDLNQAALYGLLHDAAEAYLADVPSPVKPRLIGFAEAERQVMIAIAAHFRLGPWEPEIVKAVDEGIQIDETRALMPGLDFGFGGVPGVLGDETLVPWPWRLAEGYFLKRFEMLGGKI